MVGWFRAPQEQLAQQIAAIERGIAETQAQVVAVRGTIRADVSAAVQADPDAKAANDASLARLFGGGAPAGAPGGGGSPRAVTLGFATAQTTAPIASFVPGAGAPAGGGGAAAAAAPVPAPRSPGAAASTLPGFGAT